MGKDPAPGAALRPQGVPAPRPRHNEGRGGAPGSFNEVEHGQRQRLAKHENLVGPARIAAIENEMVELALTHFFTKGAGP